MQCRNRALKIFLSEGVEGTKINQNVYTSQAGNAEENSKPRVLRKIFCLVPITFTSPKVTASKRVPRREKKGS